MKTIEHTVTFKAAPALVYGALLDSKTHAAFTGAPAEIDARVGGHSSAYGGMVTAINVDLVKDQRIVQAWRPKTMAEGVFTLATFRFEPDGKGTKLSFSHVVPDADYEHLNKGWEERYWAPLRAYLDQKASA
jgi:uncharacterized protein YndB with AHSA1/START domain